MFMLITLSLVCIVITVFVCILITRNIVRPVNEVKKAANTISVSYTHLDVYKRQDGDHSLF